MNYLHIFYFVCLGFHPIFSAPTEPKKSLYDVITEKCPSVHSLTTYKDQKLFQTCQDWKKISEVEKLTDNNRKEILCLVYFESFTQYCTHIQIPNTILPEDVLMKYSVDMICDYVKTIPHLSSIFQSIDSCKRICTDDMGFVDSVCSISYYFAHEAAVPVAKTEGSKTEQVLPKNDLENAPVVNTIKNKESVEKSPENVLTKETVKNNKVSVKVQASAPLPQKMAAHDESKASPSKDLKKPDNSGIGEAIPINHQPAQSVVDVPTADAAANAKAPVIATAEDHGANNKANEDNSAPKESKPAETADNPQKQNSGEPEDEVKPDTKPAETADVKHQANDAANPTLQEAPETDIQEIEQENMEQEKGEQSPQIPPNPDLESIDDDVQLSEGQEDENPPAVVNAVHSEKSSKPLKVEDSEPVSYATDMEGDSYFFTYFMLLCIIFIVGYVCYHNKQKVLALILEGRRGKRQNRGRRPNSANYHKLDSNLEEAITSSCKKNTTNVIY